MAIVALDAHCHADMLMRNDVRFPSHYQELGVGGITCSYYEGIPSWRAYAEYWEILKKLCQSLTQKRLPFFFAAGVHPRAVPRDLGESSCLPYELMETLNQCVRDRFCIGLGELGLDSGDGTEEKVLRWQLDWAAGALPPDKRIIIHTPRRNKMEITRRLLELLRDYEVLRGRIVIDHVSPETLPMVRALGHATGMTLQEGKTSIRELCELIRDDPRVSQTVILHSDGAASLSAPYLEFLQRKDLLDSVSRNALLLENAVRFFGIRA